MRGSSHAFACRTRWLAACQRLSASLIAGLFSSTARVTSPNESRDEAVPYSPPSAAISLRIDKDVVNKIKKVVVFIDPALRLKTCSHAPMARFHGPQGRGYRRHLGRQRPWIR